MAKGKFIVIDGVDGAGKATQTELLVKRLKKEKKKVKTIDFPRYYNNFFGKLIGEALSGKYGDFIGLDPHIASVLYAADRFESAKEIEKWLLQGYTIVADRYVSANQIHQAGKIENPTKRKNFLAWLEEMEFGVFKIPRPDLIVYLNMPVEVSRKLLQDKMTQNKKKYANGKVDLAESNLKHLEDSRKSAIKMVRESNKWVEINCAPKGELLSREEVHEMVCEKVNKLVK